MLIKLDSMAAGVSNWRRNLPNNSGLTARHLNQLSGLGETRGAPWDWDANCSHREQVSWSLNGMVAADMIDSTGKAILRHVLNDPRGQGRRLSWASRRNSGSGFSSKKRLFSLTLARIVVPCDYAFSLAYFCQDNKVWTHYSTTKTNLSPAVFAAFAALPAFSSTVFSPAFVGRTTDSIFPGSG